MSCSDFISFLNIPVRNCCPYLTSLFKIAVHIWNAKSEQLFLKFKHLLKYEHLVQISWHCSYLRSIFNIWKLNIHNPNTNIKSGVFGPCQLSTKMWIKSVTSLATVPNFIHISVNKWHLCSDLDVQIWKLNPRTLWIFDKNTMTVVQTVNYWQLHELSFVKF